MIAISSLQEAKSRLKNLLNWSDRIGSDEHHEIGEILTLLKEQEKSFEELSKRCIIWSVQDFEVKAEQRWNLDYNRESYPNAVKWEDVYDKTKFQKSLYEMIENQDSEHGISWDVVDYYLDTYCLKSKEDGRKS